MCCRKLLIIDRREHLLKLRRGHLSRRNGQHELLDLRGRNLRFCRLDIVLKLRGGHVRAGLRHGHLLQLPCRHLRGDIGDKRVQ